jgi:hypothetical protein
VPALAELLGRAAAVLEMSSHSFLIDEVLLPTKPSPKSNKTNFEGAELGLKHFSN